MKELIFAEPLLKDCLADTVQDEGITVDFHERVKPQDVVIIKVDNYYNGLRLGGLTPKSIDYLVTIDCSCNKYVMYLLELKSSKRNKNINYKDIQDKFDTTVEDFIKTKYNHIFLNDRYVYKLICLYAIAKTSMMQNFTSYDEYKRVTQRLSRSTYDIEMSLAQKVYKIKGHLCMIRFEIPPNPIMDYIV